MHLIGIHLTDVSRGHAGHASQRRASYGAALSRTSLAGMRLIGMHLVGVHLVSVYLTGVYLIGVDLIGMLLMGTGELWIISLNDLCAKLPRTRIRLALNSHSKSLP